MAIRLLDSIDALRLTPPATEYLNRLRIYYIYELSNNDPRLFRRRGIPIKDRIMNEIVDAFFTEKLQFTSSMDNKTKSEFFTTVTNQIASKQVKYIDDISIDILTLNPKIYMALKKANLLYISKIVELDRYELGLVKGLGVVGVEKVKEELHKLGLKIKGESYVDDDVIFKFKNQISLMEKCNRKISKLDRGLALERQISITDDEQLTKIKKIINHLDDISHKTDLANIYDLLEQKEEDIKLDMLNYVVKILNYIKDEDNKELIEESFGSISELVNKQEQKVKKIKK